MKRGGSLSFLVGTIRNVLVMEIGWTDVGSGGYILVSNTSSFYILDSNSDGVRSLDLKAHTSLSPIQRGFAPGFVNWSPWYS